MTERETTIAVMAFAAGFWLSVVLFLVGVFRAT